MKFCSSPDWCNFFSALQLRHFLMTGIRVECLECEWNEGRSWLSWGLKNFVQLTLLRPEWWKLDLLICTCVQMWWPYLCHVAIEELRKGIFLLNALNHKAPLIHHSAKHCQTHPQWAYKVIRKDKLQAVCIKFLANQYATQIWYFQCAIPSSQAYRIK